jgi:hypothetical protein
MPITLDIQNESLVYIAQFSRPPLEFWGMGGMIIRHFYEALQPYKIALQNFQLAPSMATAADTVLTIHIGSTIVKFSFANLEVSFSGFTASDFERIPSFLGAATGWLKPAPGFASHQANYFSHSLLPGVDLDDFLKSVNPKSIGTEGVSLGGGAIFHHVVPSKKWRTQLVIDKSQIIPGSLYVSFLIRIETADVQYDSLLAEGRNFLANAIGQFGLALPEFTLEK